MFGWKEVKCTEVKLNGLHKTINCSIPHRFTLLSPTLAHWPGDSRNYHVLHELILSYKIFRIYDNSPLVYLFYAIVIILCLFMIIFAITLANKSNIKLQY